MVNTALIALAIKNLLGQVTEGAVSDLDGPVREIAMRLSAAVGTGQAGLAQEIAWQLQVLLRIRGIRTKRSLQGGLGLILQTGVGALIDGILAALPPSTPSAQ